MEQELNFNNDALTAYIQEEYLEALSEDIDIQEEITYLITDVHHGRVGTNI